MNSYPIDLFMKLVEVFPDALNTSKESEVFEDRPGPWGIEHVSIGTETVSLGRCILDTANAISRGGQYMDRAIEYLEGFKPAAVQRREIKSFLKNRRN